MMRASDAQHPCRRGEIGEGELTRVFWSAPRRPRRGPPSWQRLQARGRACTQIGPKLFSPRPDAVHAAGIPILPPAHHYPRPVMSPTSGPQVVKRNGMSPTSGPQVVKRNGKSPQPQRPDLVLNQMGQVCAHMALMSIRRCTPQWHALARAELKSPAPNVLAGVQVADRGRRPGQQHVHHR
jgi:hypothetical protein